MIISHKHKFIFIKVRKTAGTSIQIALREFCGPDDIVSDIDGDTNIVIKGQNHNKHQFFNHISGCQIKKLIGDDIWNSYFKFGFERNPWDKAISSYYWNCARNGNVTTTLNQFIMNNGGHLANCRDWKLYTDEKRKKIIVDKIFKYEEMNDALKYLKEKLSLPSPIILPEKRFKGWTRKDHRHYREVLNKKESNRIAKLFYREIKAFEYEY